MPPLATEQVHGRGHGDEGMDQRHAERGRHADGLYAAALTGSACVT
jgi:hypothetical protein